MNYNISIELIIITICSPSVPPMVYIEFCLGSTRRYHVQSYVCSRRMQKNNFKKRGFTNLASQGKSKLLAAGLSKSRQVQASGLGKSRQV